ncbi:MAG TPA: ParB/RepB/Spo0J family partition protein, partial [Pyrinomonadaceae bacterium]|nr:ParB/RepB/Spo0J family partition protein [Pyrinomonadaceae bacterium]
IDGFKNVNELNRLFGFCRKLELKYQKAEAKPVTPTQAYYEIPLNQIDVSQTEPQSIRRLGFTPENLADITESVRQKGVLEPVLLRPLADGFELCAGERRFLAATNAGLTKIPAIVRELSDEEVDDIQLHENLHREEPHPLEEAATYDYMERKRGFDLNEISARAAKTVRYIAGRRELLKLSEKVKEIFRKNEITLSHALEISKYPADDQEQILVYAFSNFGHTSQALYPMPKFIGQIETHYLLQLSKAPFSIKSTELRADGLACENCPDRTGAKPLLFADKLDKKDSCLNRKCYEGKIQKHIQIQREKIVVETKNVPVEKAATKLNNVPILSTTYWLGTHDLKKLPEKIITGDSYTILKSLDACSKAEYGVFAHGDRNGQKVIICRKSSCCQVHWRNKTSDLPKAEKSAEVLEIESKERRDRKEEIIDVNVGEIVRRKVLAESAKSFDAENTIFNHPEKSEDYLYQLTNLLWKFQCHYSSDNAEIIRKALGVSKERLGSSYITDDQIAQLTMDERSRLLWLILHAPIAKLYENGDWKSQNPVKQIAEDFGVDYQMIDAVERLEYASKKHEKHTKEFHNYLVKLENGDRKAEIPRVYSPEYKPKEK